MKDNKENNEDFTKFGEFIPSYFAWLTLRQQKENAERLSKITKKWGKAHFFCVIFIFLEPLSNV